MQSLRREPRQARQKVASYSEEPGCSHWTSKEPPASPRTSAPIVPLPDLSQVCFWPCFKLKLYDLFWFKMKNILWCFERPARPLFTFTCTSSFRMNFKIKRLSIYFKEANDSCYGLSTKTKFTRIIFFFSLKYDFQLDESCLNALPDDMQKEIKEAYQNQQKQQQTLQCLSTVLKSPQKSSPKGKSPRKTSPHNKGRSPGKHSPQFKVPRGRPGRGRPKKLEFRQRGQLTIFSAVTGRQVQ